MDFSAFPVTGAVHFCTSTPHILTVHHSLIDLSTHSDSPSLSDLFTSKTFQLEQKQFLFFFFNFVL